MNGNGFFQGVRGAPVIVEFNIAEEGETQARLSLELLMPKELVDEVVPIVEKCFRMTWPACLIPYLPGHFALLRSIDRRIRLLSEHQKVVDVNQRAMKIMDAKL